MTVNEPPVPVEKVPVVGVVKTGVSGKTASMNVPEPEAPLAVSFTW